MVIFFLRQQLILYLITLTSLSHISGEVDIFHSKVFFEVITVSWFIF